MKRVLVAIGRGLARIFVVLLSIADGIRGGHSTDDSARELYVDPKEYRP
jgi:hypothetical protein